MSNIQNQDKQSNILEPNAIQHYCTYDDLPLVMTVEQTAKALHIGKPLVYQLVRSGKLRSLKIGRKIRVPKNSIIDYLDNLL